MNLAAESRNDRVLVYLTPTQLAMRLSLKPATIRQKLGEWGEADGVFRLGPRCTRIDWTIFEARFRAGKLGEKGR